MLSLNGILSTTWNLFINNWLKINKNIKYLFYFRGHFVWIYSYTFFLLCVCKREERLWILKQKRRTTTISVSEQRRWRRRRHWSSWSSPFLLRKPPLPLSCTLISFPFSFTNPSRLLCIFLQFINKVPVFTLTASFSCFSMFWAFW